MKDTRPPFRALEDLDPFLLFQTIPTPSFILDRRALRTDGEILKEVQEKSGCRILLAQKAFSNYDLYPLLSEYLAGTEASGLYEARLGKEEMGEKEVHVFSGAYREEEFAELLSYADHIVFNSIHQLEKFGPIAKKKGKSVGLRINPEFSTQIGHDIYNPCAAGSRLGVTYDNFVQGMKEKDFSLLDGLHFHTLCQQNSDDLEKTFAVVEAKFGRYFSSLRWINFGGGHHITREDYDRERLIRLVKRVRKQYGLEVYLEPGEAVVLNAGYLLTKVLDTFDNGTTHIAILDTSAACHMPDVLEMPYRPPLYGADFETNSYPIRLGSQTCLSGDVIGDYRFAKPLQEGDKLLFGDMALYTTCKTNTFNGMPLPSIYVLNEDRSIDKIASFGYADFKVRLGRKKEEMKK